ncbi:hypothetical protein Tco_0884534, partial [Tanacetum coccineum]
MKVEESANMECFLHLYTFGGSSAYCYGVAYFFLQVISGFSAIQFSSQEDYSFGNLVKDCRVLQVELWLALALLETFDAAKKVFNKAREKLPKEPTTKLKKA